MNDNLISIIVSTTKLSNIQKCLQSLFHQTYSNIEIIVVYHDDRVQQRIMFPKNTPLIRYYWQKRKSLSASRNKGVHLARGAIIAFTDDDCVVNNNWAQTIYTAFKKHKDISCLTGNVFSYKAAIRKICPCTFSQKTTLITHPLYHSDFIGYGNNMAFRKNVFTGIGLFKEWMGVGSIGLSAEDAEMFERILLNSLTILHLSTLIVYHDRLLTTPEMNKRQLMYNCGEMACYGYFFFQGHAFARSIILENIRDSYYKTRKIVKNVLLLHWEKELIKEAWCVII